MHSASSSKAQLLLLRGLRRVLGLVALDARSLALFRVMIALTTITDILTRWPDIHHHYSDGGMFPREFILRSFTNYYWITLHMLSGSEFVMHILFFLEVVFAILLLIGYRTRTMTFLCWIFVCSVQNRNYVLGHSGDTVHRLFLFWGLFLPLGRCFSVDRALAEAAKPSCKFDERAEYDDALDENEKRHTPGHANSINFEVANFATAAYTIQLLLMYYMAHHHKTGAEWRERGVAAWMALQLDYFRTWFGDLLLIWTQGVIYANFAVLKWQHWGSMMYFIPFYNKYFKAFVVLGFLAMHAGFGMAFYLETFTWATISGVLGCTPGWVWDTAILHAKKLRPFSSPVMIHVMPNCQGCLNIAHIINQFMLPGTTKLFSTLRFPSTSLPCQCGNKCNWSNSRFFGISITDGQSNIHHGPAVFYHLAKQSPILYPLHFVLRTQTVQQLLRHASRIFHSHAIHTDDAELGVSETKFSYTPHYETLDTIGIYVDPGVSTGKKEFFADQSNNFTMNDVKEASRIGLTAAKEAFVALLLILIISANAGNVNSQYGVPPSLQPIMWICQLDQYWGMFAPRPPDITWWYNFEGWLDDGSHVELFNNGAMHNFVANHPHTFEKPDIHLSIGNHRWFKLFENGLNSHAQREDIRLYFGRWFCREYNKRNPGTKRVHKYTIHFVFERLDMEKLDGSRFPPARETIWNHLCYEK